MRNRWWLVIGSAALIVTLVGLVARLNAGVSEIEDASADFELLASSHNMQVFSEAVLEQEGYFVPSQRSSLADLEAEEQELVYGFAQSQSDRIRDELADATSFSDAGWRLTSLLRQAKQRQATYDKVILASLILWIPAIVGFIRFSRGKKVDDFAQRFYAEQEAQKAAVAAQAPPQPAPGTAVAPSYCPTCKGAGTVSCSACGGSGVEPPWGPGPCQWCAGTGTKSCGACASESKV